MREKSKLAVMAQFLGLLIVIVVMSSYLVPLWGEKQEVSKDKIQVRLSTEMTLSEVAYSNHIGIDVVKKAFKKEDLNLKVKDLGITVAKAKSQLDKAIALKTEEETKNWMKIPAKLVSWLIFFVIAYTLLSRNKITRKVRMALLLLAVGIFGVIFGTEPNPMSMVKDNVMSLAANGIIFPPRLIVFLVFLLIVFLANKFVCAWGCQIGTLQDLIFRINRDTHDKEGILRQYKLPFMFTNTVRIVSFLVFLFAAFVWSLDIISPVNPFMLYNPAVLKITAIVFIGFILILSLFVYRPWCHLFCPFGLVGWLLEKFSRKKIKVNYNSCISCKECAKACPSNAMDAILKQDKVIPDCFSCGTCINVCPTNSISFRGGESISPPEDKSKTNSIPG